MSPDTPLFGRMTLNANRIDLGRAGFSVLMIRATQQLAKLRPSDDTIIQLEMSRNLLPDSTTFDKLARAEHQFAEQIETDGSTASPFPGITIGRVVEVMSSPEYESYAHVCEPAGRQGLMSMEVELIKFNYESKFTDCSPHFPKWVD